MALIDSSYIGLLTLRGRSVALGGRGFSFEIVTIFGIMVIIFGNYN